MTDTANHHQPTNRLFYVYGILCSCQSFGQSYYHVPWGRESDPTERLMASSVAESFTYQVTGPGDLENTEDTPENKPSVKEGAQARAAWSIHRSARLRAESYAREEDLPEILEGPYDEYGTFAPTEDQGVQADSQRHGVHPDNRWDSEGTYQQVGIDKLANLREMWKAHKKQGTNIPWLLPAIEAEGWILASQRLEDSKKTDALSTRHMSRGRVDRMVRVETLATLLHAIDKACEHAKSEVMTHGKEYGQFASEYARQALAWVKILWPQYVTSKCKADKVKLAGLCPVLAANQRFLTWDQRQWLEGKRSELLAKWSSIHGLTREQAEEYHSNVVMPQTGNEYKGYAPIDTSKCRKGPGLYNPHPEQSPSMLLPPEGFRPTYKKDTNLIKRSGMLGRTWIVDVNLLSANKKTVLLSICDSLGIAYSSKTNKNSLASLIKDWHNLPNTTTEPVKTNKPLAMTNHDLEQLIGEYIAQQSNRAVNAPASYITERQATRKQRR